MGDAVLHGYGALQHAQLPPGLLGPIDRGLLECEVIPLLSKTDRTALRLISRGVCQVVDESRRSMVIKVSFEIEWKSMTTQAWLFNRKSGIAVLSIYCFGIIIAAWCPQGDTLLRELVRARSLQNASGQGSGLSGAQSGASKIPSPFIKSWDKWAASLERVVFASKLKPALLAQFAFYETADADSAGAVEALLAKAENCADVTYYHLVLLRHRWLLGAVSAGEVVERAQGILTKEESPKLEKHTDILHVSSS